MSLDNPNPYSAASTPPTTPKKSNSLLYILLGVGGILLVGCLGCAGLIVVLGSVGGKFVGKQVQAQLQADPAVQEHVGTISESSMSIKDAAIELSKNTKRHQGRDIGIKIKGDKGEGLVMCRLDQSNPQNPRVLNGELVLPNGEFHKLKE